ncbi:MAG: MgtC/SapB family protein [Candidatus Paceibacterota bacterium]|jgi:putative Mg2+ transporter-C (MgtC) family protein
MEITTIISYPDIFIGLFLAVFFGAILGVERNLAGKMAGMRTYALVSMGSALFVDVSRLVIAGSGVAGLNYDPLRLAAQIVTGIGFIGAGLVILRGGHLTGVTTAAGLWVSAGVGMACGFGLYTLALFATGLSLAIFTILFIIERDYVQDELAKKLGRDKLIKEANEENSN